jgi:hypothetical protein
VEDRRLDPGRALRDARRRLGRAQDRAADRLATLADSAPGGGIEALMRTPARAAVLTAIFSQMPRRVDRARAAGMDAVVRWRVRLDGHREPETYDLVFTCGRARIERPSPGAPDARLTITLRATELLRLATGSLDPMEAYFGGSIELAGDILLAAKLATLFRVPKRAKQ